jgi:DNA polymerase-3 subunit beta
MRGVFLHNTADGLSAVMTDGRSLVRYTVPSGDATLSIDYTLVVPTAAAELISRQLMDKATTTVMLRRSRRLFAVETESTTFVTRLIDTTYPAYEKIIPAPSPQAATVKRDALHAALSRALAVGHGRDLKLAWADDELHLVASDTIDDMIDAVVTGEDAIAIQAQFLDALLDEMRGTRVSLSVTNPNQPLRIADPDNGAFVGLLAPRFT